MDLFKEPYYKLNFIFLSLVGQWPYQNPKTRSLTRFFICVAYISFIEVQVMKLFTSKCSIELVIEVLPYLLGGMACCTKYLTCWIKIELITHILERIKYDWSALKTKTDYDILKKHVERGAVYGVFYIIVACFTVLAFMLMPVISKFLDVSAPLNSSSTFYYPIKAEYFIDSEKYFYFILLHMDLSVLVVLTTLVASDMMFITILIHACGVLDILGYNLEHCFDNIGENNDTTNRRNISYIRISNCIIYHKRIIEYIKMINLCYSTSSFIQLVFAVFTVTVTLLRLYQNLILLGNYGEATISFLHAGGYLCAMFLYFMPGQKLLDSTSNIFYKAYFGKWYFAPIQTQKLLLLLMQRARMPCSLTTASMFTASFEMFATVVQTSFSYFTVFYSIR